MAKAIWGIVAILVIAVVAFFAGVSSSRSQEPGPLTIWGGGKAGASVYTDVYVPHLVNVLANNALAGYKWGGVSDGTIANAVQVTKNPTHLAVGQLDLLRGLSGQTLPDGSGPYAFTILAENIGPECLYLITNQPGYNTFGDFLGNTWQAVVATGGPLSGSYGTLKQLSSIYPSIGEEAEIRNVGSAADIIAAMKADPTITHGFFVMRPDPASETFRAINEAGMTIIPVVDYGLEGEYEFLDLKVANGFLFLTESKSVTTACTSVALITGDPSSPQAMALPKREQRRLQVTIEKIGSVPPETLKPNISSWGDMWDSLRTIGADKAKEMMEASKAALEDILANA